MRRGWLYSSMLLADGNRQILTLHLPGELVGETSLAWNHAPFTITAATDAIVRVIDKGALRGMFERHSRLAMLIHMRAQAERVMLADRLASVGRTSARVAAPLVDALRRLRASGEPIEEGSHASHPGGDRRRHGADRRRRQPHYPPVRGSRADLTHRRPGAHPRRGRTRRRRQPCRPPRHDRLRLAARARG